MNEILHHFETMGNRCWLALVFTGESSFQGLLGAKWILSIHSTSGVGKRPAPGEKLDQFWAERKFGRRGNKQKDSDREVECARPKLPQIEAGTNGCLVLRVLCSGWLVQGKPKGHLPVDRPSQRNANVCMTSQCISQATPAIWLFGSTCG